MDRRKLEGITILLALFLLTTYSIPSCHSVTTNLWGVSINTSMTYVYTLSYEGSISNSLIERDYIFTIYNIWDNDGNNFSELLYFRQRSVSGTPDIEPVTLDDSDIIWDWEDFLSPLQGDEIYPILPISCNTTHNVGLNWSAELYTINATFVNYSVEILSSRVEIYHWIFGNDFETGAYFLKEEFIVWDYRTGWLISYEKRFDYKEPLNYIFRISISQKQEDSSLNIDLPLLLDIIGIIIGITSIFIGLYILKRFRDYENVDYPEYEEPSEPVPFTDPNS